MGDVGAGDLDSPLMQSFFVLYRKKGTQLLNKESMPEHSVYAYLNRQSTELLGAVINYCSQANRYKLYADVVPMIMEILSDRMEAEEKQLNAAEENGPKRDALR